MTMADRSLIAGAVVILVALARAQSPPPASKPAWLLGKPFSAAGLIDKDSGSPQIPAGLALLIYLPNTGCRDLISLQEEYRKTASAQGLTLVAIADENCAAGTSLKGLGPNALGFLVEKGLLRRIIRTDRLNQMLAEAGSWQGGRQIYDAQCARCHGLDGMDTNYPSIKTLGGIGNRASDAKIIEMTELTGAVDLHALSEKDRRALAAYVAGL